ncbi:SHOCT domain-containing protein [Maribacter chungangensis]|uniref:SHOCT domain-containing protein n=1 Tax=Maribacter chungangensis TaxID=1069117 RepID=A0ABW3AYS1_9FLAO
MVKYVLEAAADVSIVNAKEQLAIDYSNIKGFNEITALILETKGAKAPTSVAAQPKEIAPTATGSGMADKKIALMDLKDLLDVGVLTQEEFDAEKAKILKG